jgi:hypothetical protein
MKEYRATPKSADVNTRVDAVLDQQNGGVVSVLLCW